MRILALFILITITFILYISGTYPFPDMIEINYKYSISSDKHSLYILKWRNFKIRESGYWLLETKEEVDSIILKHSK